MRIAKWIALNSKYSRREAEQLIFDKRVSANNQLLDNPVYFVKDDDKIKIDNKSVAVNNEKTLMLVYHKPPGFVVSTKPEIIHGTRIDTVFEHFPKINTRWITIGRLDIASEGLLLATNKPNVAHFMENPETHLERQYMVLIDGKPDKHSLNFLRNGAMIDGFQYKKCNISVDSIQNNCTWLNISLYEGKNREIRRMILYIGFNVIRLVRIKFGQYELKDIKQGKSIIIK